MSDVTRILSQIDSGDPAAAEQLLPLVYDELRKLAAKMFAQERPDKTLEATALVHEAYLRLVDVEKAQSWNGRGPLPEDLDFAPLEELFRAEVFRAFLKREAITEERVELLRSWRHSGFGVDASRRVAEGDRAELESVLQYIDRPPVSLKRLEYREDSRVLYRGNYLPSLGRDHQLCSGVEFLALLIPHIALRYECKIQSFGALSTTIRRQLGWIRAREKPKSPPDVVEVEEDESEFVRLRRANWRRLIARTWLEDPSLCDGCGKPMKVISAISSPAQDDVIEKILRARGEWDPPWKRERRVRGPPRQLEMFGSEVDEDCSQVVPETEEEFNQDPLGGLEPL